MKLIQTNSWQNNPHGDSQWSGKLINLGKRFFLQLAVDSVEDVNSQVCINGISYARKAMIRCGLALDIDGTWRIDQLFPHVQEIITRHQQYFDGQEVPLFGRLA